MKKQDGLKKYLEWVTKEKAAEGKWSNGKPEGTERIIAPKVRMQDLPDEVQDNIRYIRDSKYVISKNPDATFLQQTRLVLYNNDFYVGKANHVVHDYIISWMMLKGVCI